MRETPNPSPRSVGSAADAFELRREAAHLADERAELEAVIPVDPWAAACIVGTGIGLPLAVCWPVIAALYVLVIRGGAEPIGALGALLLFLGPPAAVATVLGWRAHRDAEAREARRRARIAEIDRRIAELDAAIAEANGP